MLFTVLQVLKSLPCEQKLVGSGDLVSEQLCG